MDDATKDSLDRFEGHPWLYRRRTISLEDGRLVEAYLIERRRLDRSRVIEGGSWRLWCMQAVLAFAVCMGLAGSARAERHRDAGSDAARAAATASGSTAAASPASSDASLLPGAEAGAASGAGHPPVAPSASAGVQESVPESAGVTVKLRNAPVFTVRIAWGGKPADERARAASQALQKVAEANEPASVHVETRADVATVYVGERPIIQLGRDDALAAGDVSLGVHADSIASKIRDGLQVEQKRSGLLKIGLMLLVDLVSGIFALFLLRRVGRLWRATRSWFHEPDRVPALRMQSIEVVRPATLRMLLLGSLRLITVLLQIGIVYGWVVLALYIFEPTREYTWRLTEIVLMPASGLMSKMATAVPTLALAVVSIAALFVLLRFVGLFFESAARGETAIGWVSPDLASATSLVVRFTIVVVFLVVAIPFITGTEDSSLARVGLVAIVSLGLASTPMLASMCVGIAVVYGRGLHPGDFVSIGAHTGRIETLTLLELRLRDSQGCEVRVPHLLSLFYPLRVLGTARPVTATITVAPNTPQAQVRQLLLEVASVVGSEPELDLVSLDQGGARYRVTVRSDQRDAQHRLYCALGDALTEREIPLGTAPKP